MLAGNANRIANGEPPLEPTHAEGERDTFSQPMALARIHQYLSMATPLLWTRQPDTVGVLGLALNACDERERARGELEQIRELLDAARELWATRCLEVDDERPAGREARAPSRPHPPRGHHGGDVAVTPELQRQRRRATTLDAPVGRSLAEMLRDELGLTGTKIACDEGHCGACTVLLDGVPTLSCITLAHTVGDREVTTIEGLREHPLVDAFVRTDAVQCGFCTPGQIVSASALVEANPSPSARRSGTRWPATSAAAARIRRSRRRSARGKADPDREGGRGPLRGGLARRRGGRARAVAGGPARGRRPAGDPRHEGRCARRGEARYTADLQLPGMLHAAVLRSPHAHARVKKIDLDARARGAGRTGGDRPRRHARALGRVPATRAQPSRRSPRTRYAQAQAALELIEVEWERARAAARSRGSGRAAASCRASRARYERGDVDKALAEADVVVEAEYRTQTVLHNSMETHQSICEWEGDALDVYISTQFIWGVRDEVAGQLDLPPDKVRVVCEFMGGGFGSKNGAGRLHVHRRRAREAHRPAGALRADPARGEPRHRQPQRDDPAADRRRARRTARSSRSAASS